MGVVEKSGKAGKRQAAERNPAGMRSFLTFLCAGNKMRMMDNDFENRCRVSGL